MTKKASKQEEEVAPLCGNQLRDDGAVKGASATSHLLLLLIVTMIMMAKMKKRKREAAVVPLVTANNNNSTKSFRIGKLKPLLCKSFGEKDIKYRL